MKKIFLFMAALAFSAQARAAEYFTVGALEYKIIDEENKYVAVSSCDKDAQGALNIPESVTNPNDDTDVYTVTAIGNDAFAGCSALTSVTIPSSVTTISISAFYMCNNLIYTKENGLKYLGNSENAYHALIESESKDITSCTINNNCKIIAQYAFYACNGLTSVTIPQSVTIIGSGAFSNCENLSAVSISGSVTTIDGSAFSRCTSLTSITIPNSVTTIGAFAFSGCSGLTSVTIPNSVTSIGERAFYECSSLTSVSIPANVTTINNNTFYECNSLASAVISEGVDSIGDYAFCGCSSLTSISLPNSVTHMGTYAFSRCNESAFTKENGLKYLGNSENEYHALVGAELDDLSSCTINSNCKIIAAHALLNNRKIVSVNIPKSVTNIGSCAFNNCSNLATINVENENAVYMSEDGVLFNKDKTILIRYPGRKSGEYTIPNSVTTIEASAFEFCENLTSVIIPTSVTTIGNYAFSDCRELTTIAISEGVTTIGEYVFGDYFLEDAIIYCRVTEIPSGWNSKWNTKNYPVKLGCKILNVAANNAQYGAVSAAGYVAKSADGSLWYENNTEATLTATAQEGYHFVKWADNNDTNATRTFNVAADATFTAIFEENTENGGNENQGGNNNNPATTVGESAANAVNIYAYGNTIVVENATDEIYVYNAMGGLVCRDAACHVSTMTINGPGVYIVRTGNVTKRVMVN